MAKKTILCFMIFVVWITNEIRAQQKPNIIFIMADDLGSYELGCYGNSFNETPNLDELASKGMKFNQAYSAAPLCSPSRAAIVTGQYPARMGITDFLDNNASRYLDPEKYYTINEALSDAGYHTGIIGKWHLDTKFDHPSGNPKQHGFDEVIGSETKYIADGDYFFPYDKIATFKDGAPGEYLTDRQCKEASHFIKRNKDHPFFLYLPFYSVHTKLDAPEELINKYKQKFDKKYGAGSAEKIYGEHNQRHEGKQRDNPYLAAMIERIDKGVGDIMQTLKKTGLEQNTLILFFSDNGGVAEFANNGILRAGKTWLYEGGIRENLIARWPAVIAAGSTSDEVVSGIDFYPTFTAIAGAPEKPGNIVDGKNIMPVFKGNQLKGRDTLYWHYPSETGRWVRRMSSAVREGHYKLLHFYADDRIELYDLAKDPSEKNNIASHQPQKAKALKAALDHWRISVNAEVPDISKTKKKRKR